MDLSVIKSNALRTVEEGTLLAIHSEQEGMAVIQLYDTSSSEPRLIAENRQQIPDVPNPSGHTMTDGERGVKDIELTASNKQLIQRLMDAMLGIKPAPLTDFFDGDNYINHNPKAWDGLSGFAKGMEERKKSGIVTKYHRLRTIMAQGNYVFCITEGAMNDVPTAFFDLFRIENGKAAEHWDVVAPITETTFRD